MIDQPTQSVVHVNDPASTTSYQVNAPAGSAPGEIAYVNILPASPSAEWGSQGAAALQVSTDNGQTWGSTGTLKFVGGATRGHSRPYWLRAGPASGQFTDNETIVVANSIASSDPAISALTLPTVKVTLETSASGLIIDQDTEPTTIVAGQTTYTYALTLNKQPAPGQTVTVTAGGAAQNGAPGPLPSGIQVSQPTVTFNSSDWNIPQTVTVSSTLSGLYSAQSVDIEQWLTTSTDSTPIDAGGVNLTVTATNTPGVALLQPQGPAEVSSSETYTYGMVLTQAPTADVVVSILSTGQTIASSSAQGFDAADQTVTFTSSDWNVPVWITLGMNASYQNTSHVTQSVATTDPTSNYNGVSVPSVNVALVGSGVAVNNQPTPTVTSSGLVINPGTAPTTIVAGETTYSYTLSLSKEPALGETVTVNLTGAGGGALPAGVSLSQSTLTFNWTDWNVPQTVTVSASPTSAHSAQPVDIEQSIVSTDPYSDPYSFFGLWYDFGSPVFTTASDVGDVDLTVAANDAPGVLLLEPQGVPEVSSNTPYTYGVVLTEAPTSNVTVDVVTDGQTTPSVGSITFTPQDWDVPVAVKLTVNPNYTPSTSSSSGGSSTTTMKFADQPHTLAQINGPLYIDGGSQPGLPTLQAAIALPYETKNVPIEETTVTAEGSSIPLVDTLDIYDDGATGQTGLITTIPTGDVFGGQGDNIGGVTVGGQTVGGLDLPSSNVTISRTSNGSTTTYEGGISWTNLDVVNIFLGGERHFTIDTTAPTVNARRRYADHDSGRRRRRLQ